MNGINLTPRVIAGFNIAVQSRANKLQPHVNTWGTTLFLLSYGFIFQQLELKSKLSSHPLVDVMVSYMDPFRVHSPCHVPQFEFFCHCESWPKFIFLQWLVSFRWNSEPLLDLIPIKVLTLQLILSAVYSITAQKTDSQQNIGTIWGCYWNSDIIHSHSGHLMGVSLWPQLG